MTRTHLGQHGPTCFGCKVQSVTYSASCSPSRRGAQRVIAIGATEKRWDKDIPAYQSMVKQGVQPRTVDGCHNVALGDHEKFEIETAIKVPKGYKQAVKDTLIELGHSEHV